MALKVATFKITEIKYNEDWGLLHTLIDFSFVADVAFNTGDTSIKGNCILLESNSLLNELVGLLLKEIDLVNVNLLEF